MSHELGLKSRERRIAGDDDAARTINQVPIGNRRMFFENQFRSAVWLMSKVTRGSLRKTRDPVSPSDPRLGGHVDEIEVLANRKRSDLRAGFHDEPLRPDPGETYP